MKMIKPCPCVREWINNNEGDIATSGVVMKSDLANILNFGKIVSDIQESIRDRLKASYACEGRSSIKRNLTTDSSILFYTCSKECDAHRPTNILQNMYKSILNNNQRKQNEIKPIKFTFPIKCTCKKGGHFGNGSAIVENLFENQLRCTKTKSICKCTSNKMLPNQRSGISEFSCEDTFHDCVCSFSTDLQSFTSKQKDSRNINRNPSSPAINEYSTIINEYKKPQRFGISHKCKSEPSCSVQWAANYNQTYPSRNILENKASSDSKNITHVCSSRKIKNSSDISSKAPNKMKHVIVICDCKCCRDDDVRRAKNIMEENMVNKSYKYSQPQIRSSRIEQDRIKSRNILENLVNTNIPSNVMCTSSKCDRAICISGNTQERGIRYEAAASTLKMSDNIDNSIKINKSEENTVNKSYKYSQPQITETCSSRIKYDHTKSKDILECCKMDEIGEVKNITMENLVSTNIPSNVMCTSSKCDRAICISGNAQEKSISCEAATPIFKISDNIDYSIKIHKSENECFCKNKGRLLEKIKKIIKECMPECDCSLHIKNKWSICEPLQNFYSHGNLQTENYKQINNSRCCQSNNNLEEPCKFQRKSAGGSSGNLTTRMLKSREASYVFFSCSEKFDDLIKNIADALPGCDCSSHSRCCQQSTIDEIFSIKGRSSKRKITEEECYDCYMDDCLSRSCTFVDSERDIEQILNTDEIGLMEIKELSLTSIMVKYEIPKYPGIKEYKLYVNDKFVQNLRCDSSTLAVIRDLPPIPRTYRVVCIEE